MKKNKMISIMIVCGLMATSFAFSQDKPDDIIKVHSLNAANKPLKELPSYKSIRIVELEKVPLVMQISKVKKLDMNNDFLFIQTNEALYTYTHDGQLVAQIGKQGNREGEYVQLNTFYVNNKKKEIGIIDDAKKRLLHYNFFGNYLYTDTLSQDAFQWCYQTLMATDKELLIYSGMSMNDTKAYSLFDLDKKEVVGRYFSYQPITLDNYVQPFSWHPMAQSGKDIDVIMPLCDTVYTYLAASSSFKPKYVIETSQKMAPKARIRKHTPSYTDDLLKLSKEGYFTGFTGIFETDTKVLLSYDMGGYFLFDKSSKEGSFCLSRKEDQKGLAFYTPFCTYKNEFVTCQKGKVLSTQMQVKDDKIRKQLKNLRSDSTCLVFYEFE